MGQFADNCYGRDGSSVDGMGPIFRPKHLLVGGLEHFLFFPSYWE
jgi:hypothetical protein